MSKIFLGCFVSFLFFASGVFVALVFPIFLGFSPEPLKVAVISAPIQVHLFIESKPGTNIWLDRKIWKLNIAH